MTIWFHLSLDPERREEALLILGRRGITVRDGSADLAPDRAVVVAVRESPLSQSAARAEGAAEVLGTLHQAGITARLLAVENPRGLKPSGSRWHVLRPRAELNGLLRRVDSVLVGRRFVVGAMRGQLAAHLLGVGLSVAAPHRKGAKAIAHSLRPGARVIRVVALSGPLRLGATPGPRLDTLDLFILPVVLLTSFLVGMYGSAAPGASVNIGLLVAIVALVAAAAVGTYAARLARLGRVSVICALGALLSWELQSAFPDPRQTTGQIVFAVVGLLLGVGVVIEWRSRRLGASAPWVVPLAVTLLGGLTIALGTLEHWAYTAALGLPYGALVGDTTGKVVVGIVPLAVAIAVALGVTGLYGLIRWLLGSEAVSSSLIVLTAVMGMLLAALFAINDGFDDARNLAIAANEEKQDLPYFSVMTPSWVCVMVTSDDAAVEGGRIDDADPWVLLGEHEGRYVLWRSTNDHRRVGVDVLSVAPVAARASCPS